MLRRVGSAVVLLLLVCPSASAAGVSPRTHAFAIPAGQVTVKNRTLVMRVVGSHGLLVHRKSHSHRHYPVAGILRRWSSARQEVTLSYVHKGKYRFKTLHLRPAPSARVTTAASGQSELRFRVQETTEIRGQDASLAFGGPLDYGSQSFTTVLYSADQKKRIVVSTYMWNWGQDAIAGVAYGAWPVASKHLTAADPYLSMSHIKIRDYDFTGQLALAAGRTGHLDLVMDIGTGPDRILYSGPVAEWAPVAH